MTNTCCMYKEKDNFCTALKDTEFHKLQREGKCGNMDCPFFKEHKNQLRLGDKLVEWKKARY